MIIRKSRFCAVLIAQLMLGGLAGAANIGLQGSCSYFGENLPATTEMTVPGDEVGVLITRIVEASGLARNFEIQAALVPNAAAVNLGAARYILYNPSFIQEIAAKTHNRWAATAILSHEVGHHLNGHTLQSGGSRPPLELEADFFSGFILERLGAQIEDATAVIEQFAPDAGSTTHPRKQTRLESIRAGWMAACHKDQNCPHDVTLDNDVDSKITSQTVGRENTPTTRNKALIREAQ